MGPRLFGFTKGETTYSFRLIPIGGYCAMEGEDEDSDNPRAFNNAKIWKRMIIIIAGATMNILLGLVLMFVTLIPKDSFVDTEISTMSTLSFSSVTGLQAGDKIVKINGYDIFGYTDLSFALATLPLSDVDGGDLSVYKEDCLTDLYNYALRHQDMITTQQIANSINSMLIEMQPELKTAKDQNEAYQIFCSYFDRINTVLGVEAEGYPEIEFKENRQRFRTDMTVVRDGRRVELKDVDFITLKGSDGADPQISLDFYLLPIEKNFGTMIGQTFVETGANLRMIWTSLGGLVTGRFSFNQMSGPIGIASAITQVASETLSTSGFGSAVMSIIYVMMIISVNLGIINMLPFPALDGGRFLLLLIEAIFKKPIPRKAEKYINAVGLVLLLGLSVVVAVNDIIKLVS